MQILIWDFFWYNHVCAETIFVMCKVSVFLVRRTAMILSVPAKMSMITFSGAISAFEGSSQLVAPCYVVIASVERHLGDKLSRNVWMC